MKQFLLTFVLLCGVSLLPSSVAAAVVHPGDVLRLFDGCDVKVSGEESSPSVDAFWGRCEALFSGRLGYAHGLTGDGYGGPCAIIDGFYTGGRGATGKGGEQMFRPDNAGRACVVEISVCVVEREPVNGATYNVSVNLYSRKAAQKFVKQLNALGYRVQLPSKNRESICKNKTSGVEVSAVFDKWETGLKIYSFEFSKH